MFQESRGVSESMTTQDKTAASKTKKMLKVERDATGKIFSHLRSKWLVETPEERVRQEYLCVLVNEYGFSLEQMDEESTVTERGSGKARADFLIWRSTADKLARNQPLIVVECKSDNVQIDAVTYAQGANYAQYCHAKLFVTHNNQQTKYWRVDHAKMMPNFDEIENIPHADATDTQVEELLSKLRVFKEQEFADLLQRCHDVIRNRESHDPTKAFDETAKILFIKVWIERELKSKKARRNIFSAEYLDDQIGDDPVNDLFTKTKKHYGKDALFSAEEHINLRPETSREIVRLLERYNLSDTSEDIKGIAFERFLGRTFRGEIGQFFTPRPIVEFMIQMLEPREGEVICDPASGSGGFLIRFFEIVRQNILRSADDEYREYEQKLTSDNSMSEETKAKALLSRYNDIQTKLDPKTPGSRLWHLANRCIYGTDKNDRMARTSKMNMIMHGDGHGGVHHWDGFLNVNGIFDGRFDIVLTNPPFGSKLEPDDKIISEDIDLPEGLEEHYNGVYGGPYRKQRDALKAAVNKPIVSLFDLPRNEGSSIKTEILFIERCLNLLKPGGRMGIVLPESVFNNPSAAHVRRFVEDRAVLLAIVSLPFSTFFASGATVKTSLLFLRKYTEQQAARYQHWKIEAQNEARALRATEAEQYRAVIAVPGAKQADYLPAMSKATTQEKAKANLLVKQRNDDLRKAKSVARANFAQLEREVAQDASARLRLKARYPIFMYDAGKVGVTASGAEDYNELYPNRRLPKNVKCSALEAFRHFISDPAKFDSLGAPGNIEE